jgi:hypothetical protein
MGFIKQGTRESDITLCLKHCSNLYLQLINIYSYAVRKIDDRKYQLQYAEVVQVSVRLNVSLC